MNIDYNSITYPELEAAKKRFLDKLHFFNFEFVWKVLQDPGSVDTFLRYTLDDLDLTALEAKMFSCKLGQRQTDVISVLAENSSGRVFSVSYLVLEPKDLQNLGDIPAQRVWRSDTGDQTIDLRNTPVPDNEGSAEIEAEPLAVCFTKEDIFQFRKAKALAGVPFVKNDIGGFFDRRKIPCPIMFLCAEYHDGSEQAEFVHHLPNPYNGDFWKKYGALSLQTIQLIRHGLSQFRRMYIDGEIAHYANLVMEFGDKPLIDAVALANVPIPLREYVTEKFSGQKQDYLRKRKRNA